MNCPHCGIAIPAKSKSSAGQKKFAEDQGKAQAAINVLQRVLSGVVSVIGIGEVQSKAAAKACREADALELKRMRRALNEPALLWKIYRRKDKSEGYGDVIALVPKLKEAA